MIAAIAFTLVPEGLADIAGWESALWMLIGVVIFLVGDAIVDRRFGTRGGSRDLIPAFDSGSGDRPRDRPPRRVRWVSGCLWHPRAQLHVGPAIF
jgi:hypothetical protein